MVEPTFHRKSVVPALWSGHWHNILRRQHTIEAWAAGWEGKGGWQCNQLKHTSNSGTTPETWVLGPACGRQMFKFHLSTLGCFTSFCRQPFYLFPSQGEMQRNSYRSRLRAGIKDSGQTNEGQHISAWSFCTGRPERTVLSEGEYLGTYQTHSSRSEARFRSQFR